MMPAKTAGALITAELQAFDPLLSVRFVETDDPECEDDEFEVMRDGALLRRPTDEPQCDGETFSIQCCMWGGEYAANQHFYAGDELKALRDLGQSRSPSQAARLIVNALKGN